METIVGVAAYARMAGLGSLAEPVSPPLEERAKASWIRQGLINGGGIHEPYSFMLRCGGHSLGAKSEYEHQQSEEVIRELQRQGVEVFHTHLYKGFGMAAERAEMEDTVLAARIAHQLGMKIDTYIQWDSLMYETFFIEVPQAKDWIQRDAFNQPVMIEYGYQQSFRYLPCFSNQSWIDYLKKVVRYAITEVKTDFIHFDNFTLSAEPNSCHCIHCREGLVKHIRHKYTAEQRKARFGFENVDYVSPPLWNGTNRPEKLRLIVDPAFQDWIDYRCQTMTDALVQMVDLVNELNPEVAVEINYGGIVGYNAPWIRATDFARLLPHTQVFWDESDRKAELTSDGRLLSAIRTYKVARKYDNIVLTYISAGEIMTAECLAFNQTIGFAGISPLAPHVVRYIDFYRNHRELFVGSRDVTPVAVLRSYHSITYNNSVAGLSAIQVEQTLIQRHIPFEIITDQHLLELSPAKTKALILPDTECLSDEQIQSIRKYVEDGGGLIAIGGAGQYDTSRRGRIQPGLKDLIKRQAPAQKQARQEPEPRTAGPVQQLQVGKGKAAYIPTLEFDGEPPPDQPYFNIGPEFWKQPKNASDIVSAIDWVSAGSLPMHVVAPEYVVVNHVEQQHAKRSLIHLVNYKVDTHADVGIRCTFPAKVNSVVLYAPDNYGGTPLTHRAEATETVFEVPALRVYAVIAVQWV